MISVNLIFDDNSNLYLENIKAITEKKFIESNLEIIDVQLNSLKLIVPKHQLAIDLYNVIKYDKKVCQITIDHLELGTDEYDIEKYKVFVHDINGCYHLTFQK